MQTQNCSSVLDPSATTHKVMWQDQKLKFDGIPYFVLGQKSFDCPNGKDRKKAWKQKIKEMKLQAWVTQ